MLATSLLTLLACGDFVEQPLFDAELTNRDQSLAGVDARVTDLETTVTAQAATIAQQAALLEAQQDALETLSANDLATRVATLETATTALGAHDTEVDGQLATLSGVVDAHDVALSDLDAGFVDIDGRVGTLEAAGATMASGLASVTTQAGALATAVTALQGDVADLQADSGGSSGGGLWSDEGSGSGNCARANVTTTSAGPLYVFGTVETSFSMSGGCGTIGYSACYTSSGAGGLSYGSSTTTTGVTVNAENAAGTWTRSATTTSSMYDSFFPAITSVSSSTFWYYSGYASSSYTWTVPIQTVLNIPAAGSYIIDLDVTGTASTCKLVVLQP